MNLSARVDAYKYTDAILTTVVYDDAYFLFSRRSLLLMVPPIECDLCYRFRIRTLNPNLTLTLKVTIISYNREASTTDDLSGTPSAKQGLGGVMK